MTLIGRQQRRIGLGHGGRTGAGLHPALPPRLALRGWLGPLAGVGRQSLAHRGHAGGHRPDPQRLPPRRRARRQPKVAAKLASPGTVGGVERLARADRRHAATTEWGCRSVAAQHPGGVVDLKPAAAPTSAPTG